MRANAAEFVTVRQQIHQNPELGFEENATSELVAERLTDWGYDVERGLGKTGVVGRLRRGDGNRSIGLRADMDALPIEEKPELAYRSCRPGCTFKRLMPTRKSAAHGDAALGAYYTLSLLAPFVVGESRAYLNYLRAKYLS
jgi:metal-dependent amidase/aminoacylase/carboxypeptidase family protein